MCSQTNKKEVSVMSWCSQWRLRLMWVALDPVQTAILMDSLNVSTHFSSRTQSNIFAQFAQQFLIQM